MKAFALAVLLSAILVACERDIIHNYGLNDGIYIGTCKYQNKLYYAEIEVDSNRFIEWPSGGFIYQKSDMCLTAGKFSITDDIISFKPDSFKYTMPNYPCTSYDLILSGDFSLTVFGESDSIRFSKGDGSHSVHYQLKKVISN